MPKIAVDYFYMSTADSCASQNPLLVMVDEGTGERYARAVGQKGLGNPGDMDWLIRDMSEELKCWGHAGGEKGHIILKSDGEPSIVAVCDALARYHGGKIVPERPPVGESPSNGVVEEAGKTTREFAKVLKEQVEGSAKIELAPSDPIVQWAVRWAAMLVSRYAVGKDGYTPYERRRGRRCRPPMVKFGEEVWYKDLGKDHLSKMDSRWSKGIWLGHTRNSAEHILGTTRGAVKAYSVKRQDPDNQWNGAAMKSMTGTPQQPDPLRPGLHVPIHINFDPSSVSHEPQADHIAPREPKRMHITKKILEKYGHTVGCEGCRRSAAQMDSHNHSEVCRARIWDEMGKDESGRKQQEYHEKRIANRKAAQKVAHDGGSAAGGPGNVPLEPVPPSVSVAVPLAGQEDVGEGLKGRVLYVKEEVDWPRKAFSDIAVIVCKGKRECA